VFEFELLSALREREWRGERERKKVFTGRKKNRSRSIRIVGPDRLSRHAPVCRGRRQNCSDG
jgi:hypothetical protein